MQHFMISNLLLCCALFCLVSPLCAAPTQVWVDARWTGPGNCGGHAWQQDAFASIQQGIQAVQEGGTVIVLPGRYAERVTITKPLTLQGPGAGISPNAPHQDDPFAASPRRSDAAAEAIIVPPTADLETPDSFLLAIQADGVTINGFTLDGANPLVANGITLNGVDVHALHGIGNQGGHCLDIIIIHNIIRNLAGNAIHFEKDDRKIRMHDRNMIAFNRIDNLPRDTSERDPGIWPPEHGTGIRISGEIYRIYGNTITRAATGIDIKWMHHNVPRFSPTVTHNAVQCYSVGIQMNLMFDLGPSDGVKVLVSRNLVQITPHAMHRHQHKFAVSVLTIETRCKIILHENVLTGGLAGLFVWQTPSLDAGNIILQGGVIQGSEYGIWVTNFYRHADFGLSRGSTVLLDGATIQHTTIAGIFLEDHADGADIIDVILTNGTVIRGTPTGIIVHGGRASAHFVPGDTPNGLSEVAGDYILFRTNGKTFPGPLDISTLRFDGREYRLLTDEERAALRTKLTGMPDASFHRERRHAAP